MKKLILLTLLIVGCSTEPEDCAGVTNGTAILDCAGVCNGTAVEDACGNCNGDCVENSFPFVTCGSSVNNTVIADYCGICDGGGATCGCTLPDASNYDASALSPCLYCDDGSTGSNCCCIF